MHRERAQAAAGHLIGDRKGATAVEFALLLPVLALILSGLIDVSRLILQKLQVQAAAQAGADHAQRRGWDTQAIAAAVGAATPIGAAAAPAPQLMTACVSAGAIAPTTAAACANGRPPGRYVTVTASTAFKSLAPWPGFLMPAAVNAKAVVRLP